MTKINKKEYETLKELQDEGYSWLCRDKELIDKTGWLWATEPKPIKYKEYARWITVNNTSLLEVDGDLFQFIQWEDEKPYNIQELIDEYLDDEYGYFNMKLSREFEEFIEKESEGSRSEER